MLADSPSPHVPARRRRFLTTLAVFLLLFVCTSASARSLQRVNGWSMRARIVEVEPRQPLRIFWRWGGEGLGGDVTSGELTAMLETVEPSADMDDMGDNPLTELGEKPEDRVIVPGQTYNYHYLYPGAWTEPVALSSFKGGRFLTFTFGQLKPETPLKGLTMEFEYSFNGEVRKTFREVAPNVPTVGVYVPWSDLAKGNVERLGGLLLYATQRADFIQEQFKDAGALPSRYGILTDMNGWRDTPGYGCRTGDLAVVNAELTALTRLGFNGLRGGSSMIDRLKPDEPQWHRVSEIGAGGYPVSGPSNHVDQYGDYTPIPLPNTGCPWHPGVGDLKAAAAAWLPGYMATAGATRADAVWGITVDEIGSVYGRTPEGGAHPGSCPYCRDAFRNFVREQGYTLADFGITDWRGIAPTSGYYDKTWLARYAERFEARAAAVEATKAAANDAAADLDILQDDTGIALNQMLKETVKAPAATVAPGKAAVTKAPGAASQVGAAKETEKGGEVEKDNEVEKDDDPDAANVEDLELPPATLGTRALWAADPTQLPPADQVPTGNGWALMNDLTVRFVLYTSAHMFEARRTALVAQNAAKRAALAAGRTDDPVARQPWVYTFAMRGNNFLMGGSSLDFFEWYKRADNGFVYETSNRDARIWGWDSYLCDVGRMNHTLGRVDGCGILVKPHRGAPVQRALSAAARGFSFIFWYTYGPDWAKGDSFSASEGSLLAVGRANRLLGAAEDRLFDSTWAVPAQIAVVRAERVDNNAWEEGKWLYTALQHSHLPVDPLGPDDLGDPAIDLARYRVIYLTAPTSLRRNVVPRLRAWVEAGGTLVMPGGGLFTDEAGRSYADFANPLFGHTAPPVVETWSVAGRYGATSLRGFAATKLMPATPEAAVWHGSAALPGDFTVKVGRCILSPDPAAGTEVLATWGDGAAAMTRHPLGKGAAVCIGAWPGLEYSTVLYGAGFDMKAWLADAPQALKRSIVAAPALAAGVLPVVDASHPAVEGILTRNRESGKFSLVLMNWAYNSSKTIQPQDNVTIRLRLPPGGKVDPATLTTATSLRLHQALPMTRDGDTWLVTLPSLVDGDILELD